MTPLLSATLLRAQSDRRLVQLVRAGHEAAFTTIVERYRGQLHRYCLRLLPEARADDALQQAFLQAWRALQEGREIRELRPWLYAVVHNAAVSQLRTGVYDYVELLDSVQAPEDEPDIDFERRSIMRQTLTAVAALPERQRDALLAVVLDDRPQAQVALEMGLTENGLRQLLFRARTTLRTAASALTPLPALDWLLRGGGITAPSLGDHVAEATVGAGAAAGGGTHALGAGTALFVAGTLAVTGGVTLQEHPTVQRSPAASSALSAKPAAAQPPAATGMTAMSPAARRTLRVTRTVARHRAGTLTATRSVRLVRVALLRGRHGRRVAVAPAPVVSVRPLAAVPAPTAALQPAPAETAQPVAEAAMVGAPPAAAQTEPPAPAPADTNDDQGDHSDQGDGNAGAGDDEHGDDGGDDSDIVRSERADDAGGDPSGSG